MQYFNHFETQLMTRHPDLQLSVRNLGWSGDTLTLQPRPLNFLRRREAARRAESRRHPGVLRVERIVRRGSRAAEVRAGPRGLHQDAPAGPLQRHVGAAPRAGLADRAREARAPGARRRRRAQSRAGALHRGDAQGGGAPAGDVRRPLHADQGTDGAGGGRGHPAHHQRDPPERRRRSRRRRAC